MFTWIVAPAEEDFDSCSNAEATSLGEKLLL